MARKVKQASMTSAQYREQAQRKGRSWRTNVAKPTTVDGIRFRSKVEAATYRWLKMPAACGFLLRQVRFDLPNITPIGETMQSWVVDFVLVLANHDRSHLIRVYEAKGSKAAESRDFRLRANAFRSLYPWISVMVCRLIRGEIKAVAIEEDK